MNAQRLSDLYVKLKWEVLVNTEYLTLLIQGRRMVATVPT